MRKLVIVKVGSTMPSLALQRGDFENWIQDGLQTAEGHSRIVDVRERAALPSYDAIAGIVVTGSHAMVTEHLDWSECTATWLARGVDLGLPVLGICYGHQLLAYALGGEVGYNPRGREFGTVDVYLEESARADRLLGEFPHRIKVHVGHRQSVLRLPADALRLAYSERDSNQAFLVGDCAWGVQFHPEFDAMIVRAYINAHQGELRAEGQDIGTLLGNCEDSPYGSAILMRFALLARERL